MIKTTFKIEKLTFTLEHVDAVAGDDGGIHLGVAAVERDARLGRVLLQLVVRASPEKKSVAVSVKDPHYL